jgi:hypothetical protein
MIQQGNNFAALGNAQLEYRRRASIGLTAQICTQVLVFDPLAFANLHLGNSDLRDDIADGFFVSCWL